MSPKTSSVLALLFLVTSAGILGLSIPQPTEAQAAQDPTSQNQADAPKSRALPKIERAPFTIGETLTFHSKILDETRALNVYLPLSYEAGSEAEYPVIYLLDGSADEDFIHVAGLVQFGSFSWIGMLPESIVVGIANVDRKRDFTYPSKNAQDNKELPTSGGSARFIQALEQEIRPLVEKTYRTGGADTLIGQSLGGLLATEILFKRPALFDHYVIVSPSLWWDDQSLLAAKPETPPKGTSIFIGVGKEGDIMEALARRLHAKLEAEKAPETRLWFEPFPQLDHGDTLHLAVYDAFDKIFTRSESEATASDSE